jgi:hypothetical protein
VVLCYVNIGAIDTGDPDYEEFPEEAKGSPYAGYPDETWIDVRNERVVSFMKKRLDLAGQVGCDGIDPDNIDGYDVSRIKQHLPPNRVMALRYSTHNLHFAAIADQLSIYPERPAKQDRLQPLGIPPHHIFH